MNFTEILEKVTGGSNDAGGRLASGDLSSLIIFVGRLVVACVAFAVALLVDAVPDIWRTVILVLCALVAGYDIIASAVLGILRGDYLNRSLLIILAALLGFVFGAMIEGCALVLLYQITSVFIDYAVERTRRSVLDTIYCDTAWANLIGDDGKETTVAAGSVQPGDHIVIRAGETVPCDAIVMEGESRVDKAPLGDESGIQNVKEGDEVLSGSVNLSGELRCEAASSQSDSAAARLYRSVQDAPGRGEAIPEILMGLRKYFAPIITGLAVLIAALLPMFLDISITESIRRATMFLVVASPVSMFAAIPVIRLCAGCGAARAGVLFDSCGAMDSMAAAGSVAFNQAGTLTEGSPRVVEVRAGRMGRDVLLKIAAHALSYANTPQSRSIIEAYGGQIYIDLIENFSEAPGYGVEVRVDGIPIRVGNRSLMNIGHVAVPDRDIFVEDGEECIYVAITDEYAGCIVLSDSVRPDAADGIEELRHAGVDSIVMFSSGSRDRTAKLASSLGITEYYSECPREPGPGTQPDICGQRRRPGRHPHGGRRRRRGCRGGSPGHAEQVRRYRTGRQAQQDSRDHRNSPLCPHALHAYRRRRAAGKDHSPHSGRFWHQHTVVYCVYRRYSCGGSCACVDPGLQRRAVQVKKVKKRAGFSGSFFLRIRLLPGQDNRY